MPATCSFRPFRSSMSSPCARTLSTPETPDPHPLPLPMRWDSTVAVIPGVWTATWSALSMSPEPTAAHKWSPLNASKLTKECVPSGAPPNFRLTDSKSRCFSLRILSFVSLRPSWFPRSKNCRVPPCRLDCSVPSLYEHSVRRAWGRCGGGWLGRARRRARRRGCRPNRGALPRFAAAPRARGRSTSR